MPELLGAKHVFTRGLYSFIHVLRNVSYDRSVAVEKKTDCSW